MSALPLPTPDASPMSADETQTAGALDAGALDAAARSYAAVVSPGYCGAILTVFGPEPGKVTHRQICPGPSTPLPPLEPAA